MYDSSPETSKLRNKYDPMLSVGSSAISAFKRRRLSSSYNSPKDSSQVKYIIHNQIPITSALSPMILLTFLYLRSITGCQFAETSEITHLTINSVLNHRLANGCWCLCLKPGYRNLANNWVNIGWYTSLFLL